MTTVEGNTTFYGLPKRERFQQWVNMTPEGFRFCFKMPKAVTHDGRLVINDHFIEFFQLMSIALEKLGPIMLQIPPNIGFDQLAKLEAFLSFA